MLLAALIVSSHGILFVMMIFISRTVACSPCQKMNWGIWKGLFCPIGSTSMFVKCYPMGRQRFRTTTHKTNWSNTIKSLQTLCVFIPRQELSATIFEQYELINNPEEIIFTNGKRLLKLCRVHYVQQYASSSVVCCGHKKQFIHQNIVCYSTRRLRKSVRHDSCYIICNQLAWWL